MNEEYKWSGERLMEKNNFHRPFLRCILSLLQIMTAFHSKGLSFTHSLNYCLPSSIHKLSIWSSPTLPFFKRLLPFLWHNIPCRALKELKARQSSLWNCLKTHLFISANSGVWFFLRLTISSSVKMPFSTVTKAFHKLCWCKVSPYWSVCITDYVWLWIPRHPAERTD